MFFLNLFIYLVALFWIFIAILFCCFPIFLHDHFLLLLLSLVTLTKYLSKIGKSGHLIWMFSILSNLGKKLILTPLLKLKNKFIFRNLIILEAKKQHQYTIFSVGWSTYLQNLPLCIIAFVFHMTYTLSILSAPQKTWRWKKYFESR